MWLERRRRSTRRQTYTVSANSFVASGGDNFRALTLGTDKKDTGRTDLQATVDYLGDATRRSPVDYAQHAVGAQVPAGPFSAGDTVTIPVDSLSMTGEGDTTDATMAVSIGAREPRLLPRDDGPADHAVRHPRRGHGVLHPAVRPVGHPAGHPDRWQPPARSRRSRSR